MPGALALSQRSLDPRSVFLRAALRRLSYTDRSTEGTAMADTPPAAHANKPAPSPLVGLLIPGLLIVAAVGVFVVFYFLNLKQPAVAPASLLNG